MSEPMSEERLNLIRSYTDGLCHLNVLDGVAAVQEIDRLRAEHTKLVDEIISYKVALADAATDIAWLAKISDAAHIVVENRGSTRHDNLRNVAVYFIRTDQIEWLRRMIEEAQAAKKPYTLREDRSKT